MSFKQSILLITSIFALLISHTTYAQEAELKIKQDSRIDTLIALKSRLEKENRLGNNFTIQLHYGSREIAETILKKYQEVLNTWPASIEYEEPNYKVWVGNFTTRLQVERALLKIKKEFSSAFPVNKLKQS